MDLFSRIIKHFPSLQYSRLPFSELPREEQERKFYQALTYLLLGNYFYSTTLPELTPKGKQIITPYFPENLNKEELEAILDIISPQQKIPYETYFISLHSGILRGALATNPSFSQLYQNQSTIAITLKSKGLSPLEFHILLGNSVINEAEKQGVVELYKTDQDDDFITRLYLS